MNTPNSALARRPALRLSLLACVAALCTACETLAPVPKVDVLPTTPPDLAPMAHAAPASAGSLFRTSAYRPAFEDRRARLVGDVVTIQIVESVTASTTVSTGTITTTVIDVLPNGHLVVSGEKQIGLNQTVDVMKFSGTVDPRSLQPGSIVASTQVANVRIHSRGRGGADEAQTIGWLSRFFSTLSPF